MRARTAAWALGLAALAAFTVTSTAPSHRRVHIRTQPIQTVNALAPWSATTQANIPHHVVPQGIRVRAPAVRSIASISWRTTTTRPAPTTTVTEPATTVAYDPATSGMGAPGSFQACVAWRESTDGELSSDVYGILPYIWSDVLGFAGSPYDASLATQDAAFWKLYNMDGTSPWAPYDGC